MLNWLFGTRLGQLTIAAVVALALFQWTVDLIGDKREAEVRLETATDGTDQLLEEIDEAIGINVETARDRDDSAAKIRELEEFIRKLQNERTQSDSDTADTGHMCLDPAAVERLQRAREKANAGR